MIGNETIHNAWATKKKATRMCTCLCICEDLHVLNLHTHTHTHTHTQLEKMPIKASFCDNWYAACADDKFCAADDGDFFSCAAIYKVCVYVCVYVCVCVCVCACVSVRVT